MIANLLDALYKGKVHITFQHWRTGEPIECIGTLVSETSVKQDPNTMTVIVFDTQQGCWMDIRVSTIVDWKVL